MFAIPSNVTSTIEIVDQFITRLRQTAVYYEFLDINKNIQDQELKYFSVFEEKAASKEQRVCKKGKRNCTVSRIVRTKCSSHRKVTEGNSNIISINLSIQLHCNKNILHNGQFITFVTWKNNCYLVCNSFNKSCR